jgi:hypothetical protein
MGIMQQFLLMAKLVQAKLLQWKDTNISLQDKESRLKQSLKQVIMKV